MARIINNPTVTINNTPFPISANTFTYTEGLGEQKTKIQSAGGGNIDPVDADDIELKYSKMTIVALPTVPNIENLRQFKLLGSNNVVQVSGQDPVTNQIITRTFTQARLVSDYTVQLSTDGTITTEWNAKAAI